MTKTLAALIEREGNLKSRLGRLGVRVYCALLSGLTLVGCSGDTVESGLPTVEHRDSAGVRIVESGRPAWGDVSQWSIDSVPLLDFVESATDTTHQFHQVRGMQRFSDGSFAVADRGSYEIRFYSSEGRFRTATGRMGEGPGEFTGIGGITLTTSDTLLVLDDSGRMTTIGPDGVVARVVHLPGRVMSIHALGSNEVVVVFGPTADYLGGRGLVRRPNALWRYDISGAQLDSIGQTDGYEDYMFILESGRSGWGRPLYGKRAHINTLGERIYRGNGNTMQIEELSSSGRLLRIFRLPDYPLEVTADVVNAERNVRLGDDPHPLLRQIVDQLPDPTSRPAYAQIRVDVEGAIWLRPFLGRSEQGGAEAWQVLDSDGTWLGTVDVMDGLRIMSVQRETLMGVWTDSLGVEHPRVYRLRRGS